MAKVKRQHYVPRSYLKAWSRVNKGERVVYCKIEEQDPILISTKNICIEKYLYDIPELGEEAEQMIEEMYAMQIDPLYPKILSYVQKEDYSTMDDDMRAMILVATISLIFRSPQFLRSDATIARVLEANTDVEFEEERKKKIGALMEHLSKSRDLLIAKSQDGIAISKAVEGQRFLASDNPVLIRNQSGSNLDYFDPTNMYHVPISPKYLITITPTAEHSLWGGSFGGIYSDAQVRGINYDQWKLRDRILIDSEEGLDDLIAEIEFYDDPNNPVAVEEAEKLMRLSSMMVENYEVVKKHGPTSEEYREYFKCLWEQEEIVRQDPNFGKMYIELFGEFDA